MKLCIIYSGCIISFTINGFKISKIIIKENNSLFSPYLINIYDEFSLLYCDSKKNKYIILLIRIHKNRYFFYF